MADEAKIDGKDAISYAIHHIEEAGQRLNRHQNGHFHGEEPADQIALAKAEIAKAQHWIARHDQSCGHARP